jgi:large subunit ribosomal protein L30
MALKVTQVRSGSGCTVRQKQTLKGLGLGRIGKTRILEDDGPTRGMIDKVRHLLEVEEVSK